jgi:hypothetical protein
MNPAFTLARTYLGQAYLLSRMYKQAISEFEQVLPDSSTDAKGYLGLAFAMSGQRPQAEAMLAEMISQSEKCPPSSYHLAAISLALGDVDRAFGWLNDAATERTWTMPYLKLDPILASIRGDIRFKTLLDRLRR